VPQESNASVIPQVVEYYRELQQSHHLSAFVERVQRQYADTTLIRLAFARSAETRRAATLALGFVGGEAANPVLGRLLHDPDHIVSLLAENSLKNLWPRLAPHSFREQLRDVMRRILFGDFGNAVSAANILIESAPMYAEARNQRSIALFGLELYEQAVCDCNETLELNPYHFGAAVAKGHCFLKLGDVHAAIESFGAALDINPNLEIVRKQILRLQL
jgi:tetratricopeptide (TPR) repeat protein